MSSSAAAAGGACRVCASRLAVRLQPARGSKAFFQQLERDDSRRRGPPAAPAGSSPGGEKKGLLLLLLEPDRRHRVYPLDARRAPPPPLPREELMEPEQDWVSVWPTAASFRPATVPLPVRMGYPVRGGVPPSKHGNLQLLALPNFLHLTPPAVARHCAAAIRPLTSPWPAAAAAQLHPHTVRHLLPVRITTSDFCSAGSALSHPAARTATLTVHMSSLRLSAEAERKLVELVGPSRYDSRTREVSIVADRCPTRRQNTEYALYLLTVLCEEAAAATPHPFEADRPPPEGSDPHWTDSRARANLAHILGREPGDNEVVDLRRSVRRLTAEHPADTEAVEEYKRAALRLLGLTPFHCEDDMEQTDNSE